jgi:hypothetical protein
VMMTLLDVNNRTLYIIFGIVQPFLSVCLRKQLQVPLCTFPQASFLALS